MSYTVFISYSSLDLPLVQEVRRILETAPIKVFVAEHSVQPGESLSSTIIEAIQACDLFLLLWNEHSKESAWVQSEVGIAKSEKKAILPVVLDQGVPLPGFVRGIKYLKATDDRASALGLLRRHVFGRARRKQQQDGLVWLSLGAALVFLLSSD